MRLLADVHISPRTVEAIRALGHDVVRVSEVLSPSAPDIEIIQAAIRDDRVVLTQDLDFSALVALSGEAVPSIITLRLASARVERVNERLGEILAQVEPDVAQGALVTVEDARVRIRMLPAS